MRHALLRLLGLVAEGVNASRGAVAERVVRVLSDVLCRRRAAGKVKRKRFGKARGESAKKRVIERRDDTSGDKGRTVGLLRGAGSVLLDSLGNVCREETVSGPWNSICDSQPKPR